MDTLIELIVRALISLFTGNSEKKLPPPRSVPKIPPIQQTPQQQVQRGGQQITKRPQSRTPQKRPTLKQQVAMRRNQAQNINRPPPIPLPAAVKILKQATAAAPVPPKITATQTTISSGAIRQLMVTRRSAMRTIYVLSEVVGPPVAMR
jgi:hypothetical protein